MRLFARGPLAALEDKLGYSFRRGEILERALTHRSYAYENDLLHNYERLEFLGDAVLGLVVGEWLFSEHSEVAEGALSARKARLVSERSLARYARAIGLGAHLRLGVGETRSGGSEKTSLLADSMEAVIGAAFIDGGLRAARRVVRPMLDMLTESDADAELRDAKTRLQEEAQARGWEIPKYSHLAELGPDHEKVFIVECAVGDRGTTRGEGRSKKAAEQKAAAAALRVLFDGNG